MAELLAQARPGEITAAEMARMLGYDECEVSTLYPLIYKGIITARKVPVGKLGRWLVDKVSVERYRDSLTGPGLHHWWRDPDWREIDHHRDQWHCLKCGAVSRDGWRPNGKRRPACRGTEAGLAKLGLVYAR